MKHQIILPLIFIILLNYCLSRKLEKKSGALHQSTSSQSVDFKQLTREVFEIQNKLRISPRSFIPKLQQRLNYFEGDIYAPPGKYRLRTSEGTAAVQDAIEALQNTRPLPPFTLSPEAANAAEEHSQDMAAKDMNGTNGSDGSTYESRLLKYCDFWTMRELTNTVDTDAEDIVLYLFISDGLPSRDYRNVMLSVENTQAAVSCVAHPSRTAFCTLDYTSGCKTSEDYLKLAQDVFEAQNAWRSNPQSFKPLIQERLKYLVDKTIRIPGMIPISTTEGDVPLKETLTALQGLKALPALKWVPEVAKACQDHGNDMNENNSTEHEGTDKSSPHSRINKYCQTDATGENLAFGAFNGQSVILSLFVDDGVASRGHRALLMNASWTGIGIACAPHPQHRVSCTLDYIVGECQNQGSLETTLL